MGLILIMYVIMNHMVMSALRSVAIFNESVINFREYSVPNLELSGELKLTYLHFGLGCVISGCLHDICYLF